MLAAIHDLKLLYFYGGVVLLLVVLTQISRALRKRSQAGHSRSAIDNFNARVNAWWKMLVVFTLAVLGGHIGSLIVFAVISFLAMREYMTLVPTRPSDHLTLFWSFFVIMPFQYCLIGLHWYGFFTGMIPILAFAFIPISIAIEGDTEHFLERAAKIQFGILMCIYCLSHVPALLFLKIPGFTGHDARLLLYLAVVDQTSGLLQYAWSKLIGKNRIAWRVSPSMTWEGFVAGVLSATAIGTALWWATPFTPLQSAGMSLTISVLGSTGWLVMSALKRDIGIKDFGVLIERRGGILDRIDSLCFAAPLFYHVIRYYFVP
jgi:phosphatidate cytidylyltransferase